MLAADSADTVAALLAAKADPNIKDGVWYTHYCVDIFSPVLML